MDSAEVNKPHSPFFGANKMWIWGGSADVMKCEKEEARLEAELESAGEVKKFLEKNILDKVDRTVYVGIGVDESYSMALYTTKHPVEHEEDGPSYPVLILSGNGLSTRWIKVSDITTSKFRKIFKISPKPLSFINAVAEEESEMKTISNIKPKNKKLEVVFHDILDTIEGERERTSRRKVGVMLQLPGQENECLIFQNKSTDEFEHFLDLFSDTVALKGYTGYNGGLDVSGKSGTGTHTRVLNKGGINVLLHVATLLPYTNEEQQLKKKRHIANDNVVVMFQDNSSKEPNKDPCFLEANPIKSQVIQLYIIVTLLPSKNGSATKETVHEEKKNEPDSSDESSTESADNSSSDQEKKGEEEEDPADHKHGEERKEATKASPKGPVTERLYTVNIVHNRGVKKMELVLTKKVTEEGIGEKELANLLKVLIPSAASCVWSAPVMASRLSSLYVVKVKSLAEKAKK